MRGGSPDGGCGVDMSKSCDHIVVCLVNNLCGCVHESLWLLSSFSCKTLFELCGKLNLYLLIILYV